MAFAHPETNLAELSIELGQKVADIGAGAGGYTLEAARRVGANGVVYTIDVQQELLTKLKTESRREHLNNIEIIWADAEKKGGTKLRDDSVDAVILSNVLFQAGDKKGMVDEAERILRPGGKILVIDWSDSFGGLGPKPADVFPKGEAHALLLGTGLSFLKDFAAGDHHYGLIFIKK